MRIAFDGTADVRESDPDLVEPSGLRDGLDEGRASFLAREDPEGGDRDLSGFTRTGAPGEAAAGGDEPLLDPAVAGGGRGGDEREIALLDPAPLPGEAEDAVGGGAEGEDDESGGVAIEAVDDPDGPGEEPLGGLAQGRRPRAPARDGEHPGGLVEGGEGGVGVEERGYIAGVVRPFEFQNAFSLVTHTGYAADDLRSLLRGIQRVPGSSIFYHVHHSLFRRHFTTGEFMNDFARWVLLSVGEEALGERLSAVDPWQCLAIRTARDRLVDAIEGYLGSTEYGIRVPPGKRFYFTAARTFIAPTGRSARDLREFAAGVRGCGPDAIFHHFVIAPTRLGRRDNDFSVWLEGELSESALADELSRLTPYDQDLYRLRDRIAEIVERRLA